MIVRRLFQQPSIQRVCACACQRPPGGPEVASESNTEQATTAAAIGASEDPPAAGTLPWHTGRIPAAPGGKDGRIQMDKDDSTLRGFSHSHQHQQPGTSN